MKKNIIWTIGIIILAILVIRGTQTPASTIAPECFSKEECFKPPTYGYCGMEYDCIVGKCYYKDIPCPEICNNKMDDDMDTLIDCKDPDCSKTRSCLPHCLVASFGGCKQGECWCDIGTPKWFPAEGCRCV